MTISISEIILKCRYILLFLSTDTDVSELNIVTHVLSNWFTMPVPYPRPDPCVDRDFGMNCPLAKGKQYRYKATVPVSRRYPAVRCKL